MYRLDQETWLQAVGRLGWLWMSTERQIILRSQGEVRHISVSRFRQVGLGAASLALAGWVGYSSASYFRFQETIGVKDVEIARSEAAYRDLLVDMRESRNRFISIADILENNHVHLVTLIDQNRTLKGDLESATRELEDNQRERTDADKQRIMLRQQISHLELQVDRAEGRYARISNNLETTEVKLSSALAEHDKARNRGNKLNSKVVKLETRLAGLRDSQRTLLKRITEATVGDIDRLIRLIAQTGLDADRLIGVDESRRGLGGPFIAAEDSDGEDFDHGISRLNLHMTRWQTLQKLVRRLPLVAPIDNYYVASRFGKRRDPFNKKWAFHKGVDLGGRMRERVRGVAPGTVLYAGWKGRYGRFIEIDHGYGIVTRYGHLRKIGVKKGQKVTFRQVIGLVGSSGRSTGPHLHYEILVKGKNVDPMKFLNAGKNVFKG